MCEQKTKSYIFISQIIEKDQEINDQNVVAFHFKNIGNVPVVLNNNIYFKPSSDSFVDEYKEQIDCNEKTETIYRVRFLQGGPDAKTKALLVIMKVPTKPRG